MSPEDVRQLGRASEAVGENWGSLAQPPRFGGAFNRFGVSWPVVREALSHLRSMGFIVSGKGLRQLYAKRQSSHSQESMLPNKVLRFRGTPYARFQERI
jgi:hypothetical protein